VLSASIWYVTRTDVDWDAVSTVKASHYRTKAVRSLSDAPMTPSEVADDHDLEEMAHVSRALSELCEAGLVELLVDEGTKKGRIYGLTEAGEDVSEVMFDE
jgi:DNA-binding HxlR family transcriptional regulator